MRWLRSAASLGLGCCVIISVVSAEGPTLSTTGPGEGPVVLSDRLCSDDNLYVHHDGSFEGGGAWEMGGVEPPYGGAFGEGFDLGQGSIECFSVWICRPDMNQSHTTDVYVWDGGVSGPPGSVLAVVPDNTFSYIPVYPQVGRFDVEIAAPVSSAFTIGSWGNWPGAGITYWWMWDENGPAGHPWTYVVPGIGLPEGWQNPAVVFGGTVRSMGIGVHFAPDPVPTQSTSWGSVKHLYAASGRE
jgi:hypothetical protein